MPARLAVPVLAPLLALAPAGCARDVVVDEQELEEKVGQQLEASTGNPPDAVDCPGGLTAEPGAETTCTLTGGRREREVTVVITGVDGTDVDFRLEIEDPAR